MLEMFSNPEQFARLKEMLADEEGRRALQHPKLQALLKDEEFSEAVKSKNFLKIISNRNFISLTQDPEFKALVDRYQKKSKPGSS